MKRKFLLLAIFSVSTLVACGGNTSSLVNSSVSFSSGSSSISSSISSASSPSVSTVSSSSAAPSVSSVAPSSEPVSSAVSSSISSTSEETKTGLTEEELALFALGFEADVTYSKDYGDYDFSSYLAKVKVSDDVIIVDEYSGDSFDEVTEDTAPSSHMRYENHDGKLVLADLTIDNLVETTTLYLEDPFTGEPVEGYFSDAYFGNFFTLLTIDDFNEVSKSEYSLNLDKVDDDLLRMIPRQLYPVGDTYLETHEFDINEKLTSFKLFLENGNISRFEMELEDKVGSYSTNHQKMSGVFVAAGEGIAEKLQPAEAKYPELDDALAKLRNYNFDVEYQYSEEDWLGDLTKTFEKGQADGESFVIQSLTEDGAIIKNGAYVQEENGYLYLTKHDDTYYQDSMLSEGKITSQIFPSFEISSAFFDLVDGKYVLDSSNLDLARGYESAFYKSSTEDSMHALLDFNIVIEDDKITFTNYREGYNATARAIYSNIGKVATLNLNYLDNSDDLTWSELLDGDQDLLDDLLTFISKEDLDSLPTIGGIHSSGTISFSYDGTPTIDVPYFSEDDGNECLETILAKFTADENFESIEDSYADGLFKSKSIVNSDNQYLMVEISKSYSNSIELSLSFE